MVQSTQRVEASAYHIVRPPTGHVGHECDATSVVFVAGVVQSLPLRVRLRHLASSSSLRKMGTGTTSALAGDVCRVYGR